MVNEHDAKRSRFGGGRLAAVCLFAVWLAGCAGTGPQIGSPIKTCAEIRGEQEADEAEFRKKGALHAAFLDNYADKGVALRLASQGKGEAIPKGSSGQVMAWGAEQVCKPLNGVGACARVAKDYAAYEDRSVARRLERTRRECGTHREAAGLARPGER